MVLGVAAVATVGRHHKGKLKDENFDSYAVEYRFDNETRFSFRAGLRRMAFEGLVTLAKGTKKPHTI